MEMDLDTLLDPFWSGMDQGGDLKGAGARKNHFLHRLTGCLAIGLMG